jgi:lipopolysaccharide/colanic/teichoic acid biosynthesis glycosyltransferase
MQAFDSSITASTPVKAFLADAQHFRRHVAPNRPAGFARLAAGIDRLAAALLLLLLSPVMGVVALLIWRADGAPILFGHYRVGQHGRLFRCLKFRSMYRNSEQMLKDLLASDANARAEWERDHKLLNDPRITPIGHFLRRTSLDELPQLFNVLRGEMSLVGPRPITVAELPRYGRVRWHYLSVRPGMTGLWQVSGRNDVTYEERVELDRRYVESDSLRMRLSILWRTIDVVLHGSGAR